MSDSATNSDEQGTVYESSEDFLASLDESPAANTEIKRIDFTVEDAQAVYRVLIAARALDGVMFTHDEWDHAMSAFGRACIVADAKKARAAS